MIYGSVCSGIEAASVAWHSLGWTPAWFAEIEPFPSAVLAQRWKGVPNRGDFTKIRDTGGIQLLVGGTPCQSFSIAGLRKGLDDPRGNLALEFLALADRLRPTWLVWENVPGVRSSVDGEPDCSPPSRMGVVDGEQVVDQVEYVENGAFACFTSALGQLGYGWAYRSLDAQYFGLAQRRERVFVVGYLGDWRPPAAVLFERQSLSGHPAPSRETGEGVAGTLGARSCRSVGAQDADADHIVSHCLNAGGMGRQDWEAETFVTHALRGEGFDASEDGPGRGTPTVAFSCKDHGADAGPIAPTLRSMGHDKSHQNGGGQVAVALNWQAGVLGHLPKSRRN